MCGWNRCQRWHTGGPSDMLASENNTALKPLRKGGKCNYTKNSFHLQGYQFTKYLVQHSLEPFTFLTRSYMPRIHSKNFTIHVVYQIKLHIHTLIVSSLPELFPGEWFFLRLYFPMLFRGERWWLWFGEADIRCKCGEATGVCSEDKTPIATATKEHN